jgi:hypothetical protein
MEAVERVEDGELCGFVARRGDQWLALTVFGAEIGAHAERHAAVDVVLADGLALLADRWLLRGDGLAGGDQVVCVVEARPREVTLALDVYAYPGVPTLTVTADELASGRWHLRRT